MYILVYFCFSECVSGVITWHINTGQSNWYIAIYAYVLVAANATYAGACDNLVQRTLKNRDLQIRWLRVISDRLSATSPDANQTAIEP